MDSLRAELTQKSLSFSYFWKKFKMEKFSETEEKKLPRWKDLLKKFGIGGIIFFTVKGIITSTLIYFLGKNFWAVIKDYVAQWVD
ncbi:hypothetical protein DTW91_09620 [Chryseobacterium sp. SC28]|nr:hypothetical protein DTW91_09620 [Chryseobacterium sp. SC28]